MHALAASCEELRASTGNPPLHNVCFENYWPMNLLDRSCLKQFKTFACVFHPRPKDTRPRLVSLYLIKHCCFNNFCCSNSTYSTTNLLSPSQRLVSPVARILIPPSYLHPGKATH
jgi:hypothetical protein